MEGFAAEKAKLASQSNTVSPQHSTNGAYLVDNRPSSGNAVVQRVKGLAVGTMVEVTNGNKPWYGEIKEDKGNSYVIRLGGGDDKNLHEVAQEHVKAHPTYAAMNKKRTLTLDGQHGTNTAKNVESLAQGLDFQKQGANDATQYSGPGFYYFPKGNSMDKDAKGYGHGHKLDIYTTGLHQETRVAGDVEGAIKTSASLELGLRGLKGNELALSSVNHPMNMWAERQSDQGREKVIRPHLYDKGQLLHALKVAAALPVMDPKGHLKTKEGERDDTILESIGGEAYHNTTDPVEEADKMDDAGSHKFTDYENADRPGHELIENKYGDLKMPYAIFKVLVNVAEFDFKARAHDPAKATAPQVTSVGDSLGESILPSKEELAAIIKAAVKANPDWYHAEDHEK
ncbi:hypothetical protein VRU48_02725 [Pedobacter sp. KR3-3]|uniref:SH3 domain-containing protein n=1 Tax=Pedobacter albus TaxID=3113905 RepID=A0ABU7I3H1_9SPHI|nr:hypothetical protein [Pedobacter sp. KR3-3]MEE1944005.1 hypothetical protein [Pedobacter sp. KR3-3]